MSLSIIPSGEPAPTTRKKLSSRKRRRDHNAEIDELASLLHPLTTPPSLTPTSSSDNPVRSLVPSYISATAMVDKLSVLRLTTTFLKLKSFMKDTTPTSDDSSGESMMISNIQGLMEEAMEGFLIVMDDEANILYVSETIYDYVGLSQADVIGQNLTEVTNPESGDDISDALKPHLVSTIPMTEDCTYIVSQFRQFFVKFKSTLSNSKFLSHTTVQINGNLKVKLHLLKSRDKSVRIEVVEPSAIGFVGECRVVKSAAAIIELSLPHSTFTSIFSLNFKPVSVESTVKEVVGYEPEDLLAEGMEDLVFVHPADHSLLLPATQLLAETGFGISPCFRFLTKSGDWVWMQVEASLHCKIGTSIPMYYEYKAKVLSQTGGTLKYVEQKELYASKRSSSDQSSLVRRKTRSKAITSKPTPSSSSKAKGPESIINSLKRTGLPESVIKPVLHSRSKSMNKHSTLIDLLLNGKPATTAANDKDAAQKFAETTELQRNSLKPVSPSSRSSNDSSPACMNGVPNSAVKGQRNYFKSVSPSPATCTSNYTVDSSSTCTNGAPNSVANTQSLSSTCRIDSTSCSSSNMSDSGSNFSLSPPSSQFQSPSTPSFAQMCGTFPASGSDLGEETCQNGWRATEQSFVAPFNSAKIAPNVENQNFINGCTLPLEGGGFGGMDMPPVGTALTLAVEHNLHTGEFQNTWSSCTSVTSSTVSGTMSCTTSPAGYSNSNFSSHKMYVLPHSGVSSTSNPSSRTLFPFQKSVTPHFISQTSDLNTFSNLPIRGSNFDSLYTDASSFAPMVFQNSEAVPCPGDSIVQQTDTSHPALLSTCSSSDHLMEELFSETLVQNSGDLDFNGMGSIPGGTTTVDMMDSNLVSHSQDPQSTINFIPNLSTNAVQLQAPLQDIVSHDLSFVSRDQVSLSHDQASLSDGIDLTNTEFTQGESSLVTLTNTTCGPSCDNPELQDIMQQFF